MLNKYAVFLRAVNVSGKNLVKMADLNQELSAVGFINVKTYIQSGNVVLESDLSIDEVQKCTASILLSHFNVDVDVFVSSYKELEQAVKNNPFTDTPPEKTFVTFLSQAPSPSLVDSLAQIDLKGERYLLSGCVFYYFLPMGMANSKLNNAFVEQKLKVRATARNMNTIMKLMLLMNA